MNSDELGIIFRETNSIHHYKGTFIHHLSKGVNKILINEEYNNQYIFTGGRDSIIKLWTNQTSDYSLLCNLENHIDWVTDLFYEKENKILFSCSNDKTIQFWRLDDDVFLNNSNSLNTIVNSRTIGVHNDYVKCLSYSQNDKVLYSGGFDGLIAYFQLDEYYKTNYIKVENEYLLHSTKDSSILSIDSDPSSKLLLFSAYENQLIGFDIRQKKESFYLRGHKEKINSVKINYEYKLAVSCSSDKTLKVWDIRNQRVLHNYEFHSDSILTMRTNEPMTKVLTGSKNGEIYLTDLNRSIFCRIDKLENKESILSLAISSNNTQIFCSTANCLREYKFKTENNDNSESETKNHYSNNIIKKRQIDNQTQSMSCFCLQMHKSEIIKYHIMKNKVYIITEDTDKVVKIYNVIKLKLIASFPNFSLEKLKEILDPYDVSQKSWFNVDTKLGCITISFTQNNVFTNQLNFDEDFIEKILEKTNNLTKINQNLAKDLPFFLKVDMSRSTNETNNYLHSASNLSRPVTGSFNGKRDISPLEKMNSLGGIFIISLLDRFVKMIYDRQLKYFETNFIDPKNKIPYMLFNSNDMGQYNMYSIKKQNNEKDSNEKNVTLNIQNNFFIFSQHNANITVGPSISDLDSKFELPTFLRDIIKVPNLQIRIPKGEKVDVILNNSLRELTVRNASSNDNMDELEVQASVTIIKLKEWFINKNYLDVEHLRKLVLNNREDFKTNETNEEIKTIVDNFALNQDNLWNFIDLTIPDSIVIRNNDMQLGEIREVFFKKKIIILYFKFATIESLIERKVIN